LRQELDELMGKDRNLPLKERLRKREHFDNTDVCKYNLVAFCPHDLFPNTKADLGPCQKRHDEFFKETFKMDANREYYQRKYEQELIDLLAGLIAQVDSRIRKSLSRIDAPLPEDGEKPKEVQDKIDALTQKINYFLEQAERLGEEGRLEESEALMKEIEKLKIQKSELMSVSENPLMHKEKQMRVCEICGAMQSLTDTEKRLTTHLEGKLHTGYALIRKVLTELKQKKEEYRRKREKEREKKFEEQKKQQEEERVARANKTEIKKDGRSDRHEEHRHDRSGRHKEKGHKEVKVRSKSRSRSKSKERKEKPREKKKEEDKRYNRRSHSMSVD